MLEMLFNFDSDSEKRVFNLYDTDIGKNTYLGTFLFGYDDLTGQKEIVEYSTDKRVGTKLSKGGLYFDKNDKKSNSYNNFNNDYYNSNIYK